MADEGGRRRRPGRRKEDRVQGTQLIDVAREAFIRHLALDRWRDVEDLRETNGLTWEAALREAGGFVERWPYHALWRRRWEAEVIPAAGSDPGAVFAAIEGAVTSALAEEEAERAARGDRPLAEDPGFKAFLDWTYGRLIQEASGQLERPPQ